MLGWKNWNDFCFWKGGEKTHYLMIRTPDLGQERPLKGRVVKSARAAVSNARTWLQVSRGTCPLETAGDLGTARILVAF